jgi:hypothetical protein
MDLDKLTGYVKIVMAMSILIVLIIMVFRGSLEIDAFMKWATALLGLIQVVDGARLLKRSIDASNTTPPD